VASSDVRRDGPSWSLEYHWLRSKLSEQALEAAKQYAEWVHHRNRWLGFPEYRMPGDDLTVSEHKGRKCLTGLIMAPPGVKTFERLAQSPSPYEPRRPDLSSDGVERDDWEGPPPHPEISGTLTGKLAQDERPSAADAARAATAADEAAQLLQQRLAQIEHYNDVNGRSPAAARRRFLVEYDSVVEYDGSSEVRRHRIDRMCCIPEGVCGDGKVVKRHSTFRPRRPFKSPDVPPPDHDEPCPECTGCKLQSTGNGPCEFRERIKLEDAALRLLLRTEQRPRRALLDSFALDGQYPAPWEVDDLEKILTRLHQFFQAGQRGLYVLGASPF
jgi:hypothetical protein